MSSGAPIPAERTALPNASAKRGKELAILGAIVSLVILHFAWLATYQAPAIATPDAHSYFAQARHLAREGTLSFSLESPVQFLGPHWHPGAYGRYCCTHAPGLGVILAAPYALLGYQAATWVNPLLASLCLLLVFLVCRCWMGPYAAMLAASLAALIPLANEHALFGDAHIAVEFFLLGSLWCLSQMARRASLFWALGAGLCAGALPALRYAEGLFLLALVLFVGVWTLKRRLPRRLALAFALAAALPVLALLMRNHFAYGAFWKTGYLATGEQTAFTGTALGQHLPLYLLKLLVEGLGVLFPLGIAGIGALIAHKDTRAQGLLLAGLVVPVILLYSAYHWQPDPQSMRFLLPTFPLYIMAGTWLLSRRSSTRTPAGFALLGLLLVNSAAGIFISHLALRHLHRDTEVLAAITSTLERRVPAGSVIISSIGVQQHLDFVGVWKLADTGHLRPRLPEQRPALEGPTRDSPDTRPLLSPGALQEFVNATRSWAGAEGKVFLLLKAYETSEWKKSIPAGLVIVELERIQLPLSAEGATEQQPRPGPPVRPGPNAIFDLQLDGQPLVLSQLQTL